MILKLCEDYLLRGWLAANCALVHKPTHQVRFYKQSVFNLLLLADGMTDLEEDILSDEEKTKIDELIEKKVLCRCEGESPITEEQQYRIYENRFIQSVLWSVTGRCNFRCRHCYMDAPNGQLGEISHEEAVSIIDQMAECGILEVALTGGEPFVRSDIMELIARLSEHGIWISQIYTNGWLVNEKILDELEALGQKPEFSFSFDGLGWHDWMRGVNGAEQRVLDVIRLCQSRGFSTSMEACLHNGSMKTFRETVKLMGTLNTRMKVGSIMQTELWKQKGEGYGFTDEEYFEAMLDYIPKFFEDGMPADLTLGAVIRLNKGSTDFRVIAEKYDGSEACLDRHLCGAARMNAYITPEGRLLPCMPMTSWEGHREFRRIQDIGLAKGLTDGLYMEFVNAKIRDLLAVNEKCGKCEYRLRCGGGCRACALSEEGELFGSDPGQCLYWQRGYVTRIRQAAEDAIAKYCN